jgi:hypothetical protein
VPSLDRVVATLRRAKVYAFLSSPTFACCKRVSFGDAMTMARRLLLVALASRLALPAAASPPVSTSFSIVGYEYAFTSSVGSFAGNGSGNAGDAQDIERHRQVRGDADPLPPPVAWTAVSPTRRECPAS